MHFQMCFPYLLFCFCFYRTMATRDIGRVLLSCNNTSKKLLRHPAQVLPGSSQHQVTGRSVFFGRSTIRRIAKLKQFNAKLSGTQLAMSALWIGQIGNGVFVGLHAPSCGACFPWLTLTRNTTGCTPTREKGRGHVEYSGDKPTTLQHAFPLGGFMFAFLVPLPLT